MTKDGAPAMLPKMSVVIVGRDGMPSLAGILTCLSQQTIAASLEMIAVLPAQAFSADAMARWAGVFHTVRAVKAAEIDNRGRAAAAGVRVASAPILAFSENHCYPVDDWAEQLCAGYSDDCVGVAPVVLNANPNSELSWASYGGGYAVFAARDVPEDIDEMPLHNTSYRRSAVVSFDNELEDLMEHEGKLQRRLLSAGGRFRLQAAAKTRHINEATWVLVLGLSFFNGWRYGGNRGLPPWKRGVYAALFPLLSINITRETMRRLDKCRDGPRRSVRLLFVVWLQSLAHAAGEVLGYIAGPRHTFSFVDREEFMVLERLGKFGIKDPEIAEFVDLAVPVRQA